MRIWLQKFISCNDTCPSRTWTKSITFDGTVSAAERSQHRSTRCYRDYYKRNAAHLLLLGQGRVQTCPNVDPLAGHGDILTVWSWRPSSCLPRRTARCLWRRTWWSRRTRLRAGANVTILSLTNALHAQMGTTKVACYYGRDLADKERHSNTAIAAADCSAPRCSIFTRFHLMMTEMHDPKLPEFHWDPAKYVRMKAKILAETISPVRVSANIGAYCSAPCGFIYPIFWWKSAINFLIDCGMHHLGAHMHLLPTIH